MHQKGNQLSIDYSDMAFPKPGKRKKKKSHKKSIMYSQKGICYLCAKKEKNYQRQETHEHHVMFGSSQRTDSEAEGLKVYLCLRHHGTGREGVHGSRAAREELCEMIQTEYEQTHTRKEWMDRFKKNYKEDETCEY